MIAILRLPAAASWLLPSGEIVESPFQPEGAAPSPITRADLEVLHDYACRPTTDVGLKYETYAALHGLSCRASFVPVEPWSRRRAVERCAEQWRMLQAMGGVR